MDLIERLRFDASQGVVVREPPGTGYGNWVGGKVSFDAGTGRFVLFYRERRPLEQGRAGRCAVAVSDDGIRFTDVWEASKEDLNANSIEEGHCLRVGDMWHLYVSYEIAGTSTWRIDVMQADDPASFSAQARRTVLSPTDFGLPWIKDPYVLPVDDELWLYAAVPARQGSVVDGDVINAAPMDATIRSVSADGLYFPGLEYAFEAPGDDSWHGRRARLNSVIPWDEGYRGVYDGGRTFYDHYEAKAGLAWSDDGISWTRISADNGPWLSSPHGSVRYVCGVIAGENLHLYYEYTREDGSHDLRVGVLEL